MNAPKAKLPGEPIYILAGGRSERFGSNKALVNVFGQPLVLSLKQQMQEAGLEVCLVSQSVEDYKDLKVRTICDLVPNAGPLAGLIAALMDCKLRSIPKCFVTSCDILEWNPTWIERLSSAFGNPSCLIAVLKSQKFMPFPGLYHVDTLSAAQSCFEQGVRSMRGLFETVSKDVFACSVSENQLPRSFNTPSELRNLSTGNREI